MWSRYKVVEFLGYRVLGLLSFGVVEFLDCRVFVTAYSGVVTAHPCFVLDSINVSTLNTGIFQISVFGRRPR